MATLDEALAQFLRKERGQRTYAAFAKELGIAESTLHRLMHGNQSSTLEMVEQILKGLQTSPKAVFGNEIERSRTRRK